MIGALPIELGQRQVLPLGELLRDQTSDQLWFGANFIRMHDRRDYEASEWHCIPISPRRRLTGRFRSPDIGFWRLDDE